MRTWLVLLVAEYSWRQEFTGVLYACNEKQRNLPNLHNVITFHDKYKKNFTYPHQNIFSCHIIDTTL
jgi:hypothetical protein